MKKFLPGRKSNSNGSSEPENDDVTERRGATFSSATPPPKQRTSSSVLNMTDPLKRRYRDQKVVGLADGLRASLNPVPVDQLTVSKKVRYDKYNGDIPLEDDEKYARSKVERRPLVLVVIGYFTALKIFLYYLISLSSLITIGLSVGMTIFWYYRFKNDPSGQMTGTGMDWVLLGFAVITPLSLSVGIAFRRRERALVEIAKFRSFAYQLFLSHCIWDWGLPPDGGKAASKDIDWVDHADEVLKELIAIGDELCRFLTLPTTSRSRHRMTKSGRREAARTAEVAYRLYESLYTKRFVQLSQLSERIKLAGLGASEVSRMRQYERFMGDAIENLRMVKTYRTPQTLRSFARLFTTLLPPFFAPTYAQLSINLNSLAIGVIFAVITALCLNALLEGVEILEDPFVAFVTLDGIDVREEFQVLHWQQLVSARNNIFPMATPYGGQANFFITSEQMVSDIESSLSVVPGHAVTTETPLGNASEATHASRRRRRHNTLSLGDASFLVAGLVDDIELQRESGYQLCARNNKKPTTSDATSSHVTSPPKHLSIENKDGDQQPMSS
eukprot:CAMPEP_0183763698 /NCGR_PEP_ID=MMETSP0739-20130205/9867_1 /TAXON_ID=385413 /ORGANISM="Thalassiosira miniscula, Strain CCMP1093" /LENGTH=557 /DNA_ID=CAMNT_0026002157 /DNA_START=130 /DNA_END=1803 /DNA_ORIENTATION=+